MYYTPFKWKGVRGNKMGLFGKKKNNKQAALSTEKTVDTTNTKSEPTNVTRAFDYDEQIRVTSVDKLFESGFSLATEVEPDAIYYSYSDLIEDYLPCGRHRGSDYFKEYFVSGPNMLPSKYIKKSEVEEQIKGMIKVDHDIDMFTKIVHKEPDFYKGAWYTTNEDLEIYKDYITNERKPMKLDNAEGAYFFEINGVKYITDTPSYWLFLYKEFGFLKEDKLAICE